MKVIDLNTWNRKEHFEFFTSFDNPFFGLVTEIDCTKAYQFAKHHGRSFFAHYLYQSTMALNETEAFRYRIKDGQVVAFEAIHAASTIGRADGTFGFSFIPFSSHFSEFQEALKQEIKAVEQSTGLRANEDARRIDVVHYSSLPWNVFTGLTHARNYGSDDSVPKISFGKAHLRGDQRILPISVDVHHGLLDGWHVAKYLERFQELMNQDI